MVFPKLVEFCNQYSLVSEKKEIEASDTDDEKTIDSIVTGKSLAQSKQERQEFEEYFAAIKEAKLNGTIVPSTTRKDKEVECYYSDSRQYEEYYTQNAAWIKMLDGRVLAIIEDKKGVIRSDLVMTTKGLYVRTRFWYDYDSSIKPLATYDEIRLSGKKNAIIHMDGRKIYDQDAKEIDYEAFGELLHKMKLIYEKYNGQNSGNDACRTIMLAVQSNCAEALQKMLCSADNLGE